MYQARREPKERKDLEVYCRLGRGGKEHEKKKKKKKRSPECMSPSSLDSS